MRIRVLVLSPILWIALILLIGAFVFHHDFKSFTGSDGDGLKNEEDGVRKLKVFVYELPQKYNMELVERNPGFLSHMFAAEVYMHRFLLSSPIRTLNPEEADWFYVPVYTEVEITGNYPDMMASALELISSNWPYWNRREGADHFFVVPHDYGACFRITEESAVERGILPQLQKSTLVQTFGQENHVCFKNGSIVIPPYVPPHKLLAHLLPRNTPRPIFFYFRGSFYADNNPNAQNSYSRGIRGAIWEKFKDNPIFDISAEHSPTYYEDIQRSVFCLCPLGWAPWSPRLVETIVFGCIPVIIADNIVLPFNDVIPWQDIGVFVDEKDALNLDSILISISSDEILRKQSLMDNDSFKNALLFTTARPGNAFLRIIDGLGRKLPHGENVSLRS